MKKYAIVTIQGSRMYVMRQKTGNITVVLPGDFTNVTDKLSANEMAKAEKALARFEGKAQTYTVVASCSEREWDGDPMLFQIECSNPDDVARKAKIEFSRNCYEAQMDKPTDGELLAEFEKNSIEVKLHIFKGKLFLQTGNI